MRCPTLDQLPPPPQGKTGWPWTEDSPQCPHKGPDGRPWPRVSVVTPSYNQDRFIEETIRSVLLQGYPDLEYIVIDGGSTDSSLDIIRRYEPWLTSWTSEPDRGQTHAINKGWTRATGEILAYINTDDWYLSGAISAAARQFCLSPNAGMVYGTAMIVDETGRGLRAWKAQPFDLRRMLIVGSIVPQPATFFAKAAVTTLGYLNEEREMIMDYEFCTRLGMQFPTVCIPRTLASFRAHQQSKTWLQFETMSRELVDFVSSFRPPHLSPDDWKTIQNGTLSRVHYESALAYLLHGQEGSKVVKQLMRSIRLYPPFAFKRPLLTGHIVKQVVVGYCKTAARRVTAAVMGPR